MLTVAHTYSDSIGATIQLAKGDIRRIPFPDNSFDLATCLRFLNWIDTPKLQGVMGELARVSRDKILIAGEQRQKTKKSQLRSRAVGSCAISTGASDPLPSASYVSAPVAVS